MVRFIAVEHLLNIRNEVLRNGKFLPDECRFPTDQDIGAFHLGYYFGEDLACIGSFHPQNHDQFIGSGYQLRGMAAIERYRDKGTGNRLLNFAIVYLKGQKINYLWCNARKQALQFYLNVGFEIVSDEFEIKDIGPHFVMYVQIQ